MLKKFTFIVHGTLQTHDKKGLTTVSRKEDNGSIMEFTDVILPLCDEKFCKKIKRKSKDIENYGASLHLSDLSLCGECAICKVHRRYRARRLLCRASVSQTLAHASSTNCSSLSANIQLIIPSSLLLLGTAIIKTNTLISSRLRPRCSRFGMLFYIHPGGFRMRISWVRGILAKRAHHMFGRPGRRCRD